MTVHQESLELKKNAERLEQAPELEYRAVSHDSLSMFLAAIGGAILGMLLTLLVLALINGGTLSFSGGERLTTLESKLEAVDQNVNAVSHNVDTVSQQTQELANQLVAMDGALRGEMAAQGGNLDALNTAVTQLDRTRQQFDLFLGALNEAMSAMQELQPSATDTTAESTTPAEAAPATETQPEAVAEAATLPMLSVVASPEVASNALSVLLFVDANANGARDEGETLIPEATIALTDAEGNAIASAESTENGILFSDLAAGAYTLTVEDPAGYQLLSNPQVDVTIAEAAAEGQVIYVPVAAE